MEGKKTIGLRVFNEINDLKIAVDVGFVVGVIPQTTPTGSAIRVKPCYIVFFDNANRFSVRMLFTTFYKQTSS